MIGTAEAAMRRLRAAYELAAALKERPMIALGVALMSTEEFVWAAVRAKRILLEQAMRAGLVESRDVERAS